MVFRFLPDSGQPSDMTDCSSIHGSTSSSSDVISSRGGVITPRIRVIRLVRPSSRRVLLGPDNNVAFGFAIRGGKEFGTGFFVSRVEKGSEADIKGLRIGDQVIRVNGYHVDDAVHKELTQFISCQDRLTVKVRGVGMLPIKEKTIDPLTWHIVPRHVLTSITGLDDIIPKDVRIVLKVAPKTKLGLGICKGPEWKPGIFVQFTKDFSVARDAGLRPGDQILSCNSIDFSDVLFSEAVAVMKSSQTLEMVIRTGAGLDLFPGESSGYNSSASSVTGDQSPCWGDQASKRLSMVREESQLWSDRSTLDRRKQLQNNTSETRPPDTDTNKTIIQLSENGTLINNTLISNTDTNVHLPNRSENIMIRQRCNSSSTGDENVKMNFVTGDHAAAAGSEAGSKTNGKIADICFVSRQSETKTVIVEVHRSASEENKVPSSAGAPVPPPKPPAFPSSDDGHERSLSVTSSTSSCGTVSLSSAISEELKRRQMRRTDSEVINQQSVGTINSESESRQTPKRIGNPSLGGNDNEKRHNALMDEFKRAHRRMFKNGFREDEKSERQEELSKAIVMTDEVDRATNGHFKTDNFIHYPPPPPPPQFANVTSKNSTNYNELLKRPQQNHQTIQPATPTPDYDSTPSQTLLRNHNSAYTNGVNKGTIGRVAATEMAKANGDVAEMESIESYKLQNLSSPIPRPPSLYFNPQSSGPPTMKKTTRPVSVTIGEYGGQNNRKEPSKFDFIKSNIENGGGSGGCSTTTTTTHQQAQILKDDNVSEMLRSELEKTLSRSNLKKRNEVISNSTSNLSNGIAQNGKPVLQKTQSSNIEKIANMLQSKQNFFEMNNNNRSATLVSSNRVTINIPNKSELRKTESTPPTPTNGILKNGFTKSSLGEKSITFGN